MQVLKSVGNTVTKSLNMVDNTIDTLNAFSIIGKEASEQILFETRVDNFKERKVLKTDAGLSEEELATILAM